MTIEFKKWPKIPRLFNEEYSLTEKIDGSNACIVIDEEGSIGAQSRNGLIALHNDNFGFAQWVIDNKDDLLQLGPGHHFGEWYGQGIQRNYGLSTRRFALFNYRIAELPKCVDIVPYLTNCSSENLFETIRELYTDLKLHGSRAVHGFMNPEGLVIQSKLHGARYKVLYGTKGHVEE